MADDTQTKTAPPGSPATNGSETWFSYDPGDGFETHDTENEARERALRALDYYREEAAGDGWDEAVDQVCWGKVVQQVVETKRTSKPPPDQIDEDGYDEEGRNWSQFDEIVEYDLSPNVEVSRPAPKTETP